MSNPYTLRSGSNGAHGPVSTAFFLVVAEGEAFDELSRHAYEPAGIAATIEEAREVARADMASRLRIVESDGPDAVLCPEAYALWGRDAEGLWVRVEEVAP